MGIFDVIDLFDSPKKDKPKRIKSPYEIQWEKLYPGVPFPTVKTHPHMFPPGYKGR